MSNFDSEAFLDELSSKLNEVSLLNHTSVDDHFENFYDSFKSVVDAFAPLRKATRKEKQIHVKPWLTKGLLKSIKNKNNLFSKLHKKFSENALKVYKEYRNNLNRTIKLAKEKYYRENISVNKNNQGNLWKIINELATFKSRKKPIPMNLKLMVKQRKNLKLYAKYSTIIL